MPPLCSSNGCSKTVNLNCFRRRPALICMYCRPAGSIHLRLACAPAARGARPRACHLAAAAIVQIWAVSTVLLLCGNEQRCELLSVVAPDQYQSGSRVVTGSCAPQPQQQPCIQPQNCCCWPRGRARGAFYMNPAPARAALIGWRGRRFKLVLGSFWATAVKRSITAPPAAQGLCI